MSAFTLGFVCGAVVMAFVCVAIVQRWVKDREGEEE